MTHKLGDRIVIMNNHHNFIQQGALGTIVAVYRNNVEILFDEPQFGATDLHNKHPKYRASIIKKYDLFNISRWKDLL